ncbi:hypothetical protein LTS15_009613 [Exophiala xenobiotica]|nr:hypothetical protein LTS15_009613 [Exophiala xenobiotica]
MASGSTTYYIDRKVRFLGQTGPVEEALLPEFIEQTDIKDSGGENGDFNGDSNGDSGSKTHY